MYNQSKIFASSLSIRTFTAPSENLHLHLLPPKFFHAATVPRISCDLHIDKMTGVLTSRLTAESNMSLRWIKDRYSFFLKAELTTALPPSLSLRSFPVVIINYRRTRFIDYLMTLK